MARRYTFELRAVLFAALSAFTAVAAGQSAATLDARLDSIRRHRS